MIDCFVCHCHQDDWIRRAMFEATKYCWNMNPTVNMIPLVRTTDQTPKEFQRKRRIHADIHARTNPYLLVDDDCLVDPHTNFKAAARFLNEHAEDFVILSLLPRGVEINPWTPKNYKPYSDFEVTEHYSVGGVRLCRQSVMDRWPKSNSTSYDSVHCERLRKLGYRVGYFNDLSMVHIGEGLSTIS